MLVCREYYISKPVCVGVGGAALVTDLTRFEGHSAFAKIGEGET